MLSSIRSLKLKWFCPVEKFGVFQQNLPDVAVVGQDLNGCYRQSSRSKTIDHRQESQPFAAVRH